VPLPTKNRSTLPGCQVAEALGDATAEPINAIGWLVLTVAAGATVRDAPPNSRRLAAATVHANGPAPEPSPEPPKANHSKTFEPTPWTPSDAAAARAEVITGAAAAAGAETTEGDTTTSGTATESDTAGVESLPPTGATTGSRDGTSTDPALTPATPGAATTPER
jgi:hypothetical protein